MAYLLNPGLSEASTLKGRSAWASFPCPLLMAQRSIGFSAPDCSDSSSRSFKECGRSLGLGARGPIAKRHLDPKGFLQEAFS